MDSDLLKKYRFYQRLIQTIYSITFHHILYSISDLSEAQGKFVEPYSINLPCTSFK